MRPLRAAVVLVGITALGLAVGTVLAPDVVARYDVSTTFGNDYLVVVPFGIAAAVVVLGALASRAIRGVDQATPPDPEGVPTAPAPGAEFDRVVGGGWRTAPVALRQGDQLRDRLRESAVRTVRRAEQCSRADASGEVEAGTWTDDPVAAAFLARDSSRGRESAREYLECFLAGELRVQRRARRAALAIDRIDRGGRP